MASQNDVEEKQSSSLDIPSKLDEAQKAILELKETIDEEAESLQKERQQFEVMTKKLDKVHFTKNIKLNVGGQIFKTSLETLRKDPDSMLTSMFSERFAVQPDEDDGAYFIDRDGTHFRYILNFLRTGKLVFPRENKILTVELYLEAVFYQIKGIQEELQVVNPAFLKNSNSTIINSLTAQQLQSLLSFIPTPWLSHWEILYYQANGWAPSTFHSLCDNKGPTVTLAKVGNYIFGGYSEVSWNSKNQFVEDEDSFLFTLANYTGAAPTKITRQRGGIWGHTSYGPCFGSATGITVMFMNGNQSNYCPITDSNGGFQCPTGQQISSFLYGSTNVTMNNLEVFGLKKFF